MGQASGRPPKLLDDLVAKRIVDAVRAGLTWGMAARAGGVARSTLMDWKARGRDGEEPYAAFFARVKSAESDAALESVKAVRAAGADPRHWTAHAWWLERRFPQQFALKRGGQDAKRGADPTAPMELGSADEQLSVLESLKAAVLSGRSGGDR